MQTQTSSTAKKVAELTSTINQLSKQVKLLSKKVKQLDSQSYYWTKRWQNAENQADRDMSKGNVFILKDVTDLDKPTAKLKKI